MTKNFRVTMLVLLLISLLSVFASNANAQYTCNDREYLRETLQQLESSCGGNTGGGLCEAVGYKGSTIERAVAACAKAGHSASFCNQHASCKGNRPICESVGYKGSTIEYAVAACAKAGHSASFCNQHVSCKNVATICESVGYKGSTVEDAVAACSKAGHSESFCNQHASCK